MKHIEQNFYGSDTIRAVVIGMADELTVPFALAAGILGTLTSTHIVVTAGIQRLRLGLLRWDSAVTWRRRAMRSIVSALVKFIA